MIIKVSQWKFRVTNRWYSLLTQFARDLGEVFEIHFARAVVLLSTIVVKHTDVSVIEVGSPNFSLAHMRGLT